MICDLQQNTPEWELFREDKLGASDIAPILGISPWETAYTLWERKLNLIPKKEKTQAMQRGSDLESKALRCFNQENGLLLSSRVVVSNFYDWAMASLDGFDVDNRIGVEIKCNGKENHKKAINGEIPDYYICQMQHQMFCAELDYMWYYSFDGENGIQLEVKRDKQFIENMLEKEIEFYKCMKEFIPPNMTEKDYLRREDLAWRDLSERYLNVKAQLKQFESEEKYLREALVKASSGKNSLGGGIKICKSVRKGAVDYKIIPELIGIDLEIFRSDPVVSWRITETKEGL